MQYIDTSVLVAYLVSETYSELAIQTMRNAQRKPLAISTWTETEFYSALGIKCRTQQITEKQYRDVQEHYLSIKPNWVWLPVSDANYQMASHFLKHWQTGLRAGDALHLAIATHHNALLLTLDERLAKAAKVLSCSSEWLCEAQ